MALPLSIGIAIGNQAYSDLDRPTEDKKDAEVTIPHDEVLTHRPRPRCNSGCCRARILTRTPYVRPRSKARGLT